MRSSMRLFAVFIGTTLLLSACGKGNEFGRAGIKLENQSVQGAALEAISNALRQNSNDRLPFKNAEIEINKKGLRITLSNKNNSVLLEQNYSSVQFIENLNVKRPDASLPQTTTEKVSRQSIDVLNREPNDLVELVIYFKDTLQSTGFPKIKTNEDIGIWQQRSSAFIEEVRQRRDNHYELLVEPFKTLGVEILERHVIPDAVLIKASKTLIPILSQIPEIESISARYLPIPMPSVKAGRVLAETDPLDVGVTAGPSSATNIIMIDSGVRTTHSLLQGKIANAYDCTQNNCVGGNPGEPDAFGHGTSSAAIMVGNVNMGDLYRGVSTHHMVDSLKTGILCPFDNTRSCNDFNAMNRAVTKAASLPGGTVMMDVQFCPDAGGLSLARTVNNMFNFSKVLIAANGNYGGADFAQYCGFTSNVSTVASPAMAHKVLGIGAVSTFDNRTPSYQSLGPTKNFGAADAGGRFKPDIQAPTDMTTANASSDTAMWNFNGTSASTPFAAATAALWTGILGNRGAGVTYSTMLASGSALNQVSGNTVGAGLINTRGNSSTNVIVDTIGFVVSALNTQ
jgi:serine protease AprX